MIGFIINRLKGAEHRDWMLRSSLRLAIIANELKMPSLAEVSANNMGVWPFIVS